MQQTVDVGVNLAVEEMVLLHACGSSFFFAAVAAEILLAADAAMAAMTAVCGLSYCSAAAAVDLEAAAVMDAVADATTDADANLC